MDGCCWVHGSAGKVMPGHACWQGWARTAEAGVVRAYAWIDGGPAVDEATCCSKGLEGRVELAACPHLVSLVSHLLQIFVLTQVERDEAMARLEAMTNGTAGLGGFAGSRGNAASSASLAAAAGKGASSVALQQQGPGAQDGAGGGKGQGVEAQEAGAAVDVAWSQEASQELDSLLEVGLTRQAHLVGLSPSLCSAHAWDAFPSMGLIVCSCIPAGICPVHSCHSGAAAGGGSSS